MNIKDLVIAFLVALGFALTFQYFFGKRTEETEVISRSRIAPRLEEINRPLNFEVDFIDKDLNVAEELTDVATPFAHYQFSSKGAVLTKAEFIHDVGRKNLLISTVEAAESANRCFLLALEQKTPLAYKLTEKTEDEHATQLTYQASIDDGTIIKRFVVAKNVCKIDLHVELQRSTQNELRFRLFYPSPRVPSMHDDIVHGLVNEKAGILKRTIDIVKEGRYWEIPTLFGAEDRYFVHVMTNDPQHFAQRGYFKLDGQAQLLCALETGALRTPASWTMTFYMGPKQLSLMQAVDPRLNATLEYGWTEPLSKPLLYVLNVLYSYVKNYGLAIILLTLLIKLILLPFSLRGQMRMQESAKKQKDLQQKLQYLKQKYKDDRETFNREQAELIRKHGMPGFGGCLVLFLQLPIFIALQRILYGAVELYQAPFLWIPNLASSDPYYILPIFVGIGMAFSTGMAKQGDMRQRMMSYGMALIFAAVTVQFAAGLSLYIAVSTLLTVLQNYLQTKIQKA